MGPDGTRDECTVHTPGQKGTWTSSSRPCVSGSRKQEEGIYDLDRKICEEGQWDFLEHILGDKFVKNPRKYVPAFLRGEYGMFGHGLCGTRSSQYP